MVNFQGSAPGSVLREHFAALDLVLAESALWEYLHAELEKRGVSVIKTRAPLSQAIRGGRNPYFADWDGHPSVIGNQVIAEYLAAHAILQALRSQ